MYICICIRIKDKEKSSWGLKKLRADSSRNFGSAIRSSISGTVSRTKRVEEGLFESIVLRLDFYTRKLDSTRIKNKKVISFSRKEIRYRIHARSNQVINRTEIHFEQFFCSLSRVKQCILLDILRYSKWE